MSTRTLTARDMLRFKTCERILGCDQLTPELRYEQARIARQLRNFFFTATLEPRGASVATALGAPLLARTPAFSDPLVLTDLISMVDYGQVDFANLEVFEYGGEARAFGVDYFGLSGKVPQRLIIKHERNSWVAIGPGAFPGLDRDSKGRFIGYLPRLLAPYQQLGFQWVNGTNGVEDTDQYFFQIGCRAVRALKQDNPYYYFSDSADREIKNYIRGSKPETFFLQALVPWASWIGGTTFTVKTPQMERPLLVLGASTNLQGVQCSLYDESKYYKFTQIDTPLAHTLPPPGFLYLDVPLSLWACNSDFRNYNLYNMWPVPHLLDRGGQLVMKLTSGLVPNEIAGFQETTETRNRVQHEDMRITFLCRTV